MLQIKRNFQFSISDLPLIKFNSGPGVALRAMCLSGPLNALASVVRWSDPNPEIIQNGLLTPPLPLPGPPVGSAVTLSGKIRSTTTVAVPFQVVGEQIDTVAAYAGSVPVPVFAPDGTFPDAGFVMLYFPDVNTKIEFEATISIYDSPAEGTFPEPAWMLSTGYPRLAFRNIRLRGAKPGLASGSAQVDALTLGTVRILGASICVEVSGQSWIGERAYDAPDTMPWGVVSEAGFEEELSNLDLSFLTPAVPGGGGGEIPVASADRVGGVRVGAGLSIAESGVLSALPGLVSLETYDPYEHSAGDTTEIYAQGVMSSLGEVLLVFYTPAIGFGAGLLLGRDSITSVPTDGTFSFGGADVKLGPVGVGMFTLEKVE